MNDRKKLMIAGLLILATAGCDGMMPSVQDAKVEANDRWNGTRATMLYGVAAEHFRVGQIEKAHAKVTKALSMKEDLVDARLLLARIHIERGENAAALRELHRVRETASRHPEATYLFGVAHEKKGDYREALSHYRRAYELDKSDLAPVRAAAEVLVQMGEFDRAQVYIESYVPHAESDPATFEIAGRINVLCGDHARAAGHFRRALDLDPDNDEYRRCLAQAQFRGGQYVEAAVTLEHLATVPRPSAWIPARLGDCYMAMNKPTRARDAYARACELDADDVRLQANLAKAMLATGRTRRAIQVAEQALAREADCLDAMVVLGYALVAEGEPARARNLLQRGTLSHGDSPMLWCLLGRAHAALGHRAEAIRCYTEALRREPDHRLARALLDAEEIEEVSRADAPDAR